MLELTIKAEGLVNLVNAQETIARRTKEAMAKELASLLKELRATLPHASGALRGSLGTTLISTGTITRAAIGTALPYALAVEKGTRPHRPPLAPLISWAQRKPGLVRSEKDAKRIGFLVARKIARVGTKGVGAFQRAEEKARERLAREVAEGVKAIEKELNDNGSR